MKTNNCFIEIYRVIEALLHLSFLTKDVMAYLDYRYFFLISSDIN